MRGQRAVTLAAGTAPVEDPCEQVDLAARAGYDGVGLRLEGVTTAELADIRRRLDDTGLFALDVEVVRIAPGDRPGVGFRLLEAAAAVGARHLLVVSNETDASRTASCLAALCDAGADVGVRPVLEFMRFTAVTTLADAVAVVAAAGEPRAGVLVDSLHLARSGSAPGELAELDPVLFPYAQVCDAPGKGPAGGLDALATEARHHRLLPGEGNLPLASLLGALPPGIPLSVEVISDAELARRGADGMATAALSATQSILSAIG